MEENLFFEAMKAEHLLDEPAQSGESLLVAVWEG